MKTVDRIGVMHVRGARVDVDYWPLKSEVLDALRVAIEREIDRLKAATGQHAIVVEVCASRMQITAEVEEKPDSSDPDRPALFSTRWHGILIATDLYARLLELAQPVTRYERTDPV